MDGRPPMQPGDLDLLRRALTPLFGELSDDALSEVAASGTWVEIEGGRRLIRIGELANSLYLLIRGRLRASVPAEDGSTRAIGEVAQGEAVGEMALLGGGRRNADIGAIRDSRLLRIEVEAFQELTRRHPDILWNLSRLVIRRMSHAPGNRRPVPDERCRFPRMARPRPGRRDRLPAGPGEPRRSGDPRAPGRDPRPMIHFGQKRSQ